LLFVCFWADWARGVLVDLGCVWIEADGRFDRSLLYVDADARMDTYTDAEGNKRSQLSLVARNFDVLSRPLNQEGAETNDEGLVQDAA
jgi:hypothetical protein